MAYVNPLHLPVCAASHSGYSALGEAMKINSTPSQFLSPRRRRLPQAPYTPSSKWKVAMGRSSQLQYPITFDYIGYSKQGISMMEASAKGVSGLTRMIQGPNDLVFAHTDLLRITLRIIWPGYEHVEWARSIEINAQGPITRAQLALNVCRNFTYFAEKARSEHARHPEWHLGPSGIRLDHLFLVSLVNVFEDVWQADVAVDFR